MTDGIFLGGGISIASLGYAMPGPVIAIGILIPFAAFDNWINLYTVKWFGVSVGLILSGTIFTVIFAYVVRFLTIGQGQIQSSLDKISKSQDMAALSLGYSSFDIVRKFHLPLLRGGIAATLIIVFVDCMKELPATLILRPFNFNTLAVHVYQFASDEMLGHAALGCLFIVSSGLIPLFLLNFAINSSRELVNARLR
tara:strand:+ start:15 stop:605 length:591 start_codon:yes stop_codon:yes gene_type:complete